MQNTVVVLCSIIHIYVLQKPHCGMLQRCILGKSLAHISFVHTIAEKRDTEPAVESFLIN